MKVISFLLPFVFFHFFVNAQTVHHPQFSVGAFGNFSNDVFSITSNPASLANFKQPSVGIYFEKKYLLNELSFIQTATAIPTRSGNFGIKTSYFGFNNYNETALGLVYARKLGTNFDIGVQFDYDKITVASYGKSSFVNYSVGLLFQLNENFHFAFNTYNPIEINNEKNTEIKFASNYKFGVGYKPFDKFFLAVELEKEKQQLPFVKLGIQYRFLPQILARGGIETNTALIYFGVGYFFKSFRIDVVTSHHPQLGITPGLYFFYNFKRKQK